MTVETENLNSLFNVKFKFDIARLPKVNFWTQSCILPSLTLENLIMPGMRRDVPLPGHKVEFESLVVNFIVDDNLENYISVYEWFNKIATSNNVSEMVSNCSLHFLDGNNAVTRTMDIVGAYPIVLSELSLNSDDTDIIPVTCSLTLNYQYFKIVNGTTPAWAKTNSPESDGYTKL